MSRLRDIIARHLAPADVLQSRLSPTDLLRQTPGAGMASSTEYFQAAPLTAADLRRVYGTEDEFITTYDQWADEYFNAINDHSNLAKGVKIDSDFERAIGNINLKLLNKTKQDELYQSYLKNVIRLPDLAREVGLPIAEMPSANAVNESLRYILSSAVPSDDPVAMMLRGLYFSFNDRRKGLDSINVSRDRILSPETIKTARDRIRSGGSYFSDLSDNDRIATLDIETTGVFQHSQVRSMTISEQIFQSGRLSDPSKMVSKLFDSPQLGGIIVGGRGGTFQSMTKLLEDMQRASHGEAIPMNQALDEMADVFESLMTTDSTTGAYRYKRLVGHNIKFDLTQLTHTLQGIEGFSEHDRLKNAMRAFFERQAGGDFVFDTLDVAREYLDKKAVEHAETIAAASGGNIDDIAKSYIDNLFSQEILAKVHIGGSAAPFSMTNISLNTNLFKLMTEDGQANELYDLITKGSHMDDTDTVLQSYVLKYIHEGRLDIDFREPISYDGLSDEDKRLIRAARAKVSQSSALNPTTNIADVQHLSDMAFDYFKSNDGLRKVSLNINEDVLEAIQAGISSGDIDNTGNRAQIFLDQLKRRGTGEGVLKFNAQGVPEFSTKPRGAVGAVSTPFTSRGSDNQARSIFRFVLDQARTSTPISGVEKPVGRGRSVNVLALAINSLGESYQSVSRGEQMNASINATRRVRAGTIITSSSDISDENMLRAFGSVYEAYGSGLSYEDRTALGSGFGRIEGTPFEVGLGRFDATVPPMVADALARIGDPFSFVDPKSRVISTIVANATADIGLELNTAATTAGGLKEGFGLDDIAFSAKPKLTAELGLSYFREQQASSLLKIVGSSTREASKLIVPTRIVQAAFDAATAATGPDTLRSLGLSINKYGSDSINLVWHIGEQLGETEHREVLANIVRTYADADAVRELLEGVDQEILENVMKDVNAVRARVMKVDSTGVLAINDTEVQSLVDDLMNTSRRGGIVIGNLDETMTESILGDFLKQGIDITNEYVENFRASLLRTGSNFNALVLTPFVDSAAAKIFGLEDEVKNANKIVNRGGVLVSENIDAYNRINQKLADNNLLKSISSRVRDAKVKNPPLPISDFYKANKGKIGIGLAATALAGMAYYMTKKNREEKIFDEVLEKQPYEDSGQLDPLSDIQATYNYAPIQASPLSTAGVVGNLDRNRIGHTRMGNNRNNHLFDLG